jgi:hypothetical protein
MSRITVTYDRTTLYEEVWKDPVTSVAKRYGISDVALRKVCRKLTVPVPPLGYWTRVRHGRMPPRPPLPAFKGEEQLVVTRYVPDHDPKPLPPKPVEVLAQEEFEAHPQNHIILPADLRGAHPVVAATARLEREKVRAGISTDYWELRRGALNLRVSKKSLRRALLIAQAICKGAESRGFRVRLSRDKERGPIVEVLGEEIGFQIRERNKRIERDWTPEELRKRRLDPTFRPSGLYQYKANGSFIIEFFTDRGPWVAGEMRDEKNASLDSKLNGVMAKLVELAARRREQKVEEREARLREAEEQRRRWQEVGFPRFFGRFA